MIRHFLAAAAAAALNAVHSKGDEGQHSYYDQGRLFSGVCSSSNGGGLRPYMCSHPRRPDHPGPVTLLIQSVLGDGTCTKVPIIWNMKVWPIIGAATLRPSHLGTIVSNLRV